MTREAGAVDLHTHSTCSDGALSPRDLVLRAAAAGIGVLAVTDHDTVAGLEEARNAAAEIGLQLVPGVEISATWRFQTVHVLGLWVDPVSARLACVLRDQAERRRARMRRMCASLSKLRLPGDALLAAVEANPGLPTRSHLAMAPKAGGHVHRIDDAFRRYLGAGKPAHVAAGWPALAEVIACILRRGRYRLPGAPGALRTVRRRPAPASGRLRSGGRRRDRGGQRRQWRPACRRQRGARLEIRTTEARSARTFTIRN